MITEINESKTFTKHMSCECKCKFDGRNCNSYEWWNNNNRTSKNYYPQVLSEECKNVVNEKKIPKYISDNIKISSDSGRENSDEQNSNKETSDEESFDEKNSDEEILKKVVYKFFLYLAHLVSRFACNSRVIVDASSNPTGFSHVK